MNLRKHRDNIDKKLLILKLLTKRPGKCGTIKKHQDSVKSRLLLVI
jgi:hypothetical protein